MPHRSVQVVSMRSWGELGNLLAGQTLAATLREGLDGVEVSVIEAETLFPPFATVGSAIKELVDARLPADEVHAGYLRIMADFGRVLPPGFERGVGLPPELEERVASIAEHFARTRPDLVIGTKGAISRLCLLALRRAGHDAPVVNYVTNEGLLRLPMHRSTELPLHLVQFDRARRYLLDEHGYDPRRVVPVGRLLARTQAGRFFEGDGDVADAADSRLGAADTRVLILSNRGGDEYLDLVRRLAHQHPKAAYVFIGYNNPRLATAAGQILAEHGVVAWRSFERLAQGDYLRYLDWLSGAEAPLFISKTGPNSMLEGLYHGLPQLLVRSGLPMEEWVGPFVAEYGVGQVFDRMAELTEVADRWLQEPAELPRRRARALRLASTMLDPERARRRTVAAVGAVLDGAPVPTAEEDQCSPE